MLFVRIFLQKASDFTVPATDACVEQWYQNSTCVEEEMMSEVLGAQPNRPHLRLVRYESRQSWVAGAEAQ
jgi:hypothetical protein